MSRKYLGILIGFVAGAAAPLVVGAYPTMTQNPSLRPTTTVSDGTGEKPTCSDIATGSGAVATFAEFKRYVTIQNLSSNDLEIEVNASTTSRSTCNYKVAAGSTANIACWLDRIAIKNIGAGTATMSGSSRDVIITGWR